MAKADTIYIAKETGRVEPPGDPAAFFFRAGVTKIRADHPAMKACPKFFEPLDHNARRPRLL
jgi:hypothetical protein